ncbi:RhuM family protein [Psychrobacter immobilis]|nr:RhuM family protein [Psychrobacter immobilis]
MTFYDLDVVISVGYRIKSPQGVQFRRWATQRLLSTRLYAQSTALL